MRLLTFFALASVVASPSFAGVQSSSEPKLSDLRKMALTTSAAKLKFRPDRAFPTTFGVVIDFPVGDQTATILALRDGTTSLYTTGTFGVLGGGAHPTVRKASLDLIKSASPHWRGAKPTQSTAYPTGDHVRFYLLGYHGVRMVETSMQSLRDPSNPYSPLWIAANRVLTELRSASKGR